MNKLDSSLITSALLESGFELTDHVTDADVVLINTCSVREHAEARVFSHLGHLKHIRKSNPALVVGVIGCMAQRLGSELLAHDAVDIVAGPSQIPQIPSLIAEVLSQRCPRLAVTARIRDRLADDQSQQLDQFEHAYDSDENNIPGQAFIRAMRGCNNFCTYCIVPYVRGPEVSRPPRMIVEQAKRLAGRGVRQITLLGQTINAYRHTDGDRRYTLADLLEMVSSVDGIEWVRFITSHPGRFDESILRVMAELPGVCPYLHIPAQSGSDRILAAMNRGYTAGGYMRLIDRARQIVPGIAIAGDFIVGFPGETEQDFEETVELVREARYKNCFVFKYSPRPGTRADADEKLADTIPQDVKKRRNTELLAVQDAISEQDNRRFMGRTLRVLVEGLSKKPHLNRAENEDMPQLIGRTAGDYIVVFNGPESLAGRFADVQVTKTAALTLFATLATNDNHQSETVR